MADETREFGFEKELRNLLGETEEPKQEVPSVPLDEKEDKMSDAAAEQEEKTQNGAETEETVEAAQEIFSETPEKEESDSFVDETELKASVSAAFAAAALEKETAEEKTSEGRPISVKKKPAKKKGMGTFFWVAIAILAAGLVFIGIRFGPELCSQIQGGGAHANFVFQNGISINGIDVSGKTEREVLSLLETQQAEDQAKYLVTVQYKDTSLEIKGEDMDFTYNTGEVLQKAEDYSTQLKTGSVSEGASPEFTVTTTISYDRVKEKLLAFADSINCEPSNPTEIDFDFETETFVFGGGKLGLKVNTDTLLEDVKRMADTYKTGVVKAEVKETQGDETFEEIQAHFTLISTGTTTTTHYSSDNSNFNMNLAMERVNKSVVPAGGTFSFHGAVGDSMSDDSGFLPGGAYRDGKLIYENGGGICQAATTIYEAALLADMEVVERASHLYPSTYCDAGLDATVDYPYLDLKVKNNTEYPMYIVATMSGLDYGDTLTVKIYGYKSEEYDHIELAGWYTGTIDQPATEYRVDSSMKAGEYRLYRSGKTGQTAAASRTFYDKDGNVLRTEKLPNSTYAAVAKVYYIGSGTDTSLIPSGSQSGSGAVAKPTATPTPSPAPETSESTGE